MFIGTVILTVGQQFPAMVGGVYTSLSLIHISQARFYLLLEEELTDAEKAAYRRGRNAKSFTMPKHATMKDYRMATASVCRLLRIRQDVYKRQDHD